MMLLTVADVLLRALVNRPIRGMLEIVELLLTCAFFLALPAAFLRDDHLVVDVIDSLAPRAVGALKRASEVLAIAVIALMAWEGWKAARDTLVFNDVTSDLSIPRIWYWLPVLIGMVGGGLAAAAMLFRRESR
jgi:TRAP-type C4-dicarboxylate transport system permease small subunit